MYSRLDRFRRNDIQAHNPRRLSNIHCSSAAKHFNEEHRFSTTEYIIIPVNVELFGQHGYSCKPRNFDDEHFYSYCKLVLVCHPFYFFIIADAVILPQSVWQDAHLRALSCSVWAPRQSVSHRV